MSKTPIVLGIAGGSGSGKSWLAAHLQEALGAKAALLLVDWYYKDWTGLDPAVARGLNFDHPKAIEWPLFHRHFDALRASVAVECPIYDYSAHIRLAGRRRVEPAPLLIVDGLFVLQQARLAAHLDHSVFVDLPADLRLLRRIRRDCAQRDIDLEETLRLYESFVRPMHERYIQPSAQRAHKVWFPLEERGYPRQLLREMKAALL